MNLLIVTNGPGEISTWVAPVIKAIHREDQTVRIICLIPFCQFASGEEIRLLKRIPGITAIIPPNEYLKILVKGQFPCGLRGKNGVVLHLGGDPLHSLLMAKRLAWKAAIYTYRPEIRLIRFFDRIIVLDKAAKERVVRRGVESSRVEVAGDLIVDSVNGAFKGKREICKEYGLAPDSLTIGLLAGSRKEHVRHLLPFFLKVAKFIKEGYSDTQFFTLLAPSIPEGFIESILSSHQTFTLLNGCGGKILREERGISILIGDSLKVPVIEEGIGVMSMADLALTIPGSNTGELASMGLPMMVIIPLNAPEFIPLEGIWGFVDRIPGVGTPLKRYLVKKVGKDTKFTALPNIRAKNLIVPEIRGILSPIEVAKRVIGYLRELDRDKVSGRLREIMGLPGASGRVARVILSMMESNG